MIDLENFYFAGFLNVSRYCNEFVVWLLIIVIYYVIRIKFNDDKTVNNYVIKNDVILSKYCAH